MAAFGSATWEYYGETNKASLNDFINTTLGGIAIGEVLHRAAWLMRDPRDTGSGRLWGEIGATVVDPVTGYNRFRQRRCVEGRRQARRRWCRRRSARFASAGVLWRGTEDARRRTRRASRSSRSTCSTATSQRRPQPHAVRRVRDDAAVWRRRAGERGAAARPAARRAARQDGKFQFTRRAGLRLPAQRRLRFRRAVVRWRSSAFTHPLSSRISLALLGSGGLTVLGAIDSLPLGRRAKCLRKNSDPERRQGVSEGPRYYDYGPGSKFTLRGAPDCATVCRSSVAFYEGRQLYSLDGVRANHFLQHVAPRPHACRSAVRSASACRANTSRGTPISRTPTRTENEFRYPQFRAYLTWNISMRRWRFACACVPRC